MCVQPLEDPGDSCSSSEPARTGCTSLTWSHPSLVHRSVTPNLPGRKYLTPQKPTKPWVQLRAPGVEFNLTQKQLSVWGVLS